MKPVLKFLLGIFIVCFILMTGMLVVWLVGNLLKGSYNSHHGNLCKNCNMHTQSGYCLRKSERRGDGETCARWARKNETYWCTEEPTESWQTITDGEAHGDDTNQVD